MKNIEVTINDQGIALLKLDRPDRLNAIHLDMFRDLHSALAELGTSDKVKALIITGKGTTFSAGADLNTFAELAAQGGSFSERVDDFMHEVNPAIQRLYEFPRPVVCALNGLAVGAAVSIALCADVVVASRSAAIRIVQVRQLGIVADLGANWLLARLGTRARALGACLLGETITAQQLENWGFVWKCVDADDLLAQAGEIASRLAGLSADAVLATRQLVDEAVEHAFHESLDSERRHQVQLAASPALMQTVAKFFAS